MHGPLLTGTDLRFQVREGPKYKQKKNPNKHPYR